MTTSPLKVRVRNRRTKVGHFFDECWRVNFYVLAPTTDDAVARFIKSQFGKVYESPGTAAGRCFVYTEPGKGMGIIIALYGWEMTSAWLGALAHESFHAAEAVADRSGMPHGYDSSEAFAYLVESIFRRSLDLIEK